MMKERIKECTEVVSAALNGDGDAVLDQLMSMSDRDRSLLLNAVDTVRDAVRRAEACLARLEGAR